MAIYRLSDSQFEIARYDAFISVARNYKAEGHDKAAAVALQLYNDKNVIVRGKLYKAFSRDVYLDDYEGVLIFDGYELATGELYHL